MNASGQTNFDAAWEKEKVSEGLNKEGLSKGFAVPAISRP
jgi:hypothetical protein